MIGVPHAMKMTADLEGMMTDIRTGPHATVGDPSVTTVTTRFHVAAVVVDHVRHIPAAASPATKRAVHHLLEKSAVETALALVLGALDVTATDLPYAAVTGLGLGAPITSIDTYLVGAVVPAPGSVKTAETASAMIADLASVTTAAIAHAAIGPETTTVGTADGSVEVGG